MKKFKGLGAMLLAGFFGNPRQPRARGPGPGPKRIRRRISNCKMFGRSGKRPCRSKNARRNNCKIPVSARKTPSSASRMPSSARKPPTPASRTSMKKGSKTV